MKRTIFDITKTRESSNTRKNLKDQTISNSNQDLATNERNKLRKFNFTKDNFFNYLKLNCEEQIQKYIQNEKNKIFEFSLSMQLKLQIQKLSADERSDLGILSLEINNAQGKTYGKTSYIVLFNIELALQNGYLKDYLNSLKEKINRANVENADKRAQSYKILPPLDIENAEDLDKAESIIPVPQTLDKLSKQELSKIEFIAAFRNAYGKTLFARVEHKSLERDKDYNFFIKTDLVKDLQNLDQNELAGLGFIKFKESTKENSHIAIVNALQMQEICEKAPFKAALSFLTQSNNESEMNLALIKESFLVELKKLKLKQEERVFQLLISTELGKQIAQLAINEKENLGIIFLSQEGMHGQFFAQKQYLVLIDVQTVIKKGLLLEPAPNELPQNVNAIRNEEILNSDDEIPLKRSKRPASSAEENEAEQEILQDLPELNNIRLFPMPFGHESGPFQRIVDPFVQSSSLEESLNDILQSVQNVPLFSENETQANLEATKEKTSTDPLSWVEMQALKQEFLWLFKVALEANPNAENTLSFNVRKGLAQRIQQSTKEDMQAIGIIGIPLIEQQIYRVTVIIDKINALFAKDIQLIMSVFKHNPFVPPIYLESQNDNVILSNILCPSIDKAPELSSLEKEKEIIKDKILRKFNETYDAYNQALKTKAPFFFFRIDNEFSFSIKIRIFKKLQKIVPQTNLLETIPPELKNWGILRIKNGTQAKPYIVTVDPSKMSLIFKVHLIQQKDVATRDTAPFIPQEKQSAPEKISQGFQGAPSAAEELPHFDVSTEMTIENSLPDSLEFLLPPQELNSNFHLFLDGTFLNEEMDLEKEVELSEEMPNIEEAYSNQSATLALEDAPLTPRAVSKVIDDLSTPQSFQSFSPTFRNDELRFFSDADEAINEDELFDLLEKDLTKSMHNKK